MKSKKSRKPSKKTDNLSIKGTFDEIISLSVGQPAQTPSKEQQNVTPNNKKKK